MAGEHCLVVGTDSTELTPSVDRIVQNDVLLRIAVNVSGRQQIALIDLGASQCYMSPEIAALCELPITKEVLHLELADGSQLRATKKASEVVCTVQKAVCRLEFVVTKFLHNVDLVWE